MPPTIEETKSLVQKLFEGVSDKAGKPYHHHCFRVMMRLGSEYGEDEQHAALLHDVIEDTSTTADDLRRMGYSERTVWLVEMLSRPPKSQDRPSYQDWIKSIAATGDAGLISIKLADNADNSDPTRIAALPDSEKGILRRYNKARQILLDGLRR